MQVDVQESGTFIRKLSVVLPADQVDREIGEAYKRVARKARIPGFRPGKAPLGVLEMHFGDQVKDEVNNRLVEVSLAKAMVDHEVSPVATPKIVPGELKKGTDFHYTAEVEVQPPVELNTYEGLEVPCVEATVDESELAAEFDNMREQASQVIPVTDRDIVEDADLVQIDYQGTIAGEAFEGGTAENALLEVGSGTYLPGFEEALRGQKVPGSVSFPVEFPGDYTAKDLAGKQAQFEVQLKELKVKEVPELDDDFAQDMGEEDLAGLKEKVRADLLTSKRSKLQQEEKTQVLDKLVEANDFEVAPSMIEDQIDRMLQGAVAQMQQWMGTAAQWSPQELTELRESSRPNAAKQVKRGLLLMEAAKVAEVEVTDDELQAEIEDQANRAGASAPKVRSYFSQPEELNRLRYRLLEDKTIALLLAKAVRVEAPAAPTGEE